MSTPLLADSDPHLFLLDSEGLLFCPVSSRVYYLNTSATFMWCCLEEGLELAAIAGAVSREFGIPGELAARDVEAQIAEWRSQGLLGGNRLASDSTGAGEAALEAEGQPLATSASLGAQPQENLSAAADQGSQSGAWQTRQAAGPLSSESVDERFYHAAKVDFRIRFSSLAAASLIHPVFSHLGLELGPGAVAPSTTFDVVEHDSKFEFYRDDLKLYDELLPSSLVPIVQREMLVALYELSGCLVGIHAAAFSDGCGSVLMPGVPGSGKSTLSAALLHSGLTYLTDELVLLMPGSHSVRAVRASLGLKRGSWTLLTHRFPALETLPIYRQSDGTEVRYLAPPAKASPEREEYPVEAIVFPQYVAEGATGLSELTPANALYRLARAGYAVPMGLNSEIVTDLVGWISRVPRYQLRVRDLRQAEAELRGLLG